MEERRGESQGHLLSTWPMAGVLASITGQRHYVSDCSSVRFLFLPFSASYSLERGSRVHLLESEVSPWILRILVQGRLLHLPLVTCSITYSYQYGLMEIYFIFRILIWSWISGLFQLFQLWPWELFQVAPVSLWHVPTHLGGAGGALAYFMTQPIPQAHPVCFLTQPYFPKELWVFLGEQGPRNQDPSARQVPGY